MASQIETKSSTVALPRPDAADGERPLETETAAPGQETPRESFLGLDGETLDEIRLLGHPSLDDYFDYVREKTVDGDLKIAVKEWRQANDYYLELEESEYGIADEIELLDLDPSLDPLVSEVMAESRFGNRRKNVAPNLESWK